MKNVAFGIAVLALSFLFVSSGFASAVWLDEVVSFDQPEGSSTSSNNPANALGADDSNYVAVDIPETLILAFTDNSALDGAGNDLRIREVGNDGAQANVYGSKNGVDWVFLVLATGSGSGTGNYTDIYFDLDGTGLSYVNYLKFEGLDDLGTYPGFDLDAVEALNSGANVPIPAAIWLLGSGVLGILAVRKKYRN
jgi:hypothetical protein